MAIKDDVVHAEQWNGRVRKKLSKTKSNMISKIIFYSTENASLHDSDASEKVVAIAKITIPNDDGPIEASSTIQTVPNSALYDHFESIGIAKQKSISNTIIENVKDKSDDDSETKSLEKSESSATTQCTLSTIKENDMPVPSAPSLNDLINDLKPMYNFQMRQHEFTNRTVLRSESCTYCLKK